MQRSRAIRHDYPAEVRFMVDEIRREAIRCRPDHQNLLGFARKQKPDKRYTDINTLCCQPDPGDTGVPVEGQPDYDGD